MKSYLCALFFSACSIHLSAQERDFPRHRYTCLPAAASQNFLRVDYHYESVLLQLEYAAFLKSLPLNSKNEFLFYFMLQSQNAISFSIYDSPQPIEKGWEAGINGGFQVFYQNASRWSPYLAIHAGPHYIRKGIKRQVPGFIFSDNFSAGVLVALSSRLSLDIRAGFRHLSNAGIRNPNGGINSTMIGVGLQFGK